MINPRLFPAILVLLAAIQLVLGAWELVSPSSFFESVATFGHRNDHFIRDLSSIYIATGLALLIAARVVSWRVPVLFMVTVEYLIHTVNHAFDINDAAPVFLGVFDFLSLAAITIVLGALLKFAHAQAKSGKSNGPTAMDNQDIPANTERD